MAYDVMEWIVSLNKNVQKQLTQFQNEDLLYVFRLLADSLKQNGPAPGKQWSHYGKLNTGKSADKRHCHLIKGRHLPMFVVGK